MGGQGGFSLPTRPIDTRPSTTTPSPVRRVPPSVQPLVQEEELFGEGEVLRRKRFTQERALPGQLAADPLQLIAAVTLQPGGSDDQLPRMDGPVSEYIDVIVLSEDCLLRCPVVSFRWVDDGHRKRFMVPLTSGSRQHSAAVEFVFIEKSHSGSRFVTLRSLDLRIRIVIRIKSFRDLKI